MIHKLIHRYINQSERNISQKFKKKIYTKKRHYFIDEMNKSKLMSKKLKKFCMTLNYIEYLLILASVVTGCVSISTFASLVGVPIGITSSAVEL